MAMIEKLRPEPIDMSKVTGGAFVYGDEEIGT